MALYHKYRPTQLSEMIGNENTIAMLEGDLVKPDRPHAILLVGPTGCGKTTLGRIIANRLGAKDSDFREIDSADYRGIDSVREIRNQSQYKSLQSDCRVWLLDEIHKSTGDAQAALLKALEDPPSHVYYILATTDPQKLLPTIRGRCSQYQVAPLRDGEMFQLLRRVVKAENETLQKPVYEQIIQDSQGSPRNALQILDQVLGVPAEKRLEVARHQAETQNQTIELCRALFNRTAWKSLAKILSSLKEQEQDAENIRRAIMGYCSSTLLKDDHEVAAIILEQMLRPQIYNPGWPGLVEACYSSHFEINREG